MMRDEFVRRRGWLDDAEFVDMLGASSLIPGPTSSELAMHIGHRRGGWPGLIIAGLAFIMPAVVIVGALAWLYVEQGGRPEVGTVLATIAPVVVAVIAHAGLVIARSTVRTPLAASLVAMAVVAVLLGQAEIVVLLGVGVVALAFGTGRRWWDRSHLTPAIGVPLVVPWAMAWDRPATTGVVTAGAAAAAGAMVVAPLGIFVEMARVGAALFGSGYVIVALFRSEFVDRLGWISEAQLLDAVAVGQATPGPLFSTATFVGYLADGPSGAVAATVGIFAPAFVAVAVSIPVLARIRRSVRAREFLDGVNAATIGLLGVVAVQLGMVAVVDPLSIAIAVGAFALLAGGVGSPVLIGMAAIVGLLRLSVGA